MIRRAAGILEQWAPWGGAADEGTDASSTDQRDRPAGGEPTAPDAGLDGVSECRTLADVLDTDALDRWLPPAWSAGTEVTQLGNDPVTEVLVLEGRGHRMVLDPVRAVEPEERVTCHVRPAGSKRRREWRTFDSLQAALAAALGGITDLDDHVDPVTPSERRAARSEAVRRPTGSEERPHPTP